ncbi:MAG: T9SS type A sorting domain-containing protein, partial [Bacteroidota bacterium]
IPFTRNQDQGSQWQQATILLKQYTGSSNFRFRFIASGSNFRGDQGDIAVDNVRIAEAPPCFEISVAYDEPTCAGGTDGRAELLLFPANTTGLSVTWSTGATNVTTLNNLPAGNYSVQVTDNANCTATKQFTLGAPTPVTGELYITPATPGQSDGRIFLVPAGGTPPYAVQWLDGTTGTTYGFKPAGYTEVKITDANGCLKRLYTFLPEAVNCNQSFNNFPYRQDFEGNGLGQFRQGADDDLNWRRRSGATPTANTGPTAAVSGNQYRYLEASRRGNPFKSGALYTKRCFDLRGVAQPQLYFQYHMHGADAKTLLVQVSPDGGFTWRESAWVAVGDQGDQWKQAFVDLSPYQTGTVQLRIVGVTGAGALSDLAIDDVQIKSALTPINVNPGSNRAISTASLPEDTPVRNALLYPNPTLDVFRLTGLKQETVAVRIYDAQGRLIRQLAEVREGTSVDVRALPAGLYHVRLGYLDGHVTTSKLIKR